MTMNLTVEFTTFRGYLQLDHPVTCEKINVNSHIQMTTSIKSYDFFHNLLPLTLKSLRVTSVVKPRPWKKVLETFYVK